MFKRFVLMVIGALLAIACSFSALAACSQSYSEQDCSEVHVTINTLRNEHNMLINAYNAWFAAPDGPIIVPTVSDPHLLAQKISSELNDIKATLAKMSHPSLQEVKVLNEKYWECAKLMDQLAAGEDISDEMSMTFKDISNNMVLLVQQL